MKWNLSQVLTQQAAVVALAMTLPSANAGAAPAYSFARDIRPILSDNCFACHGPDDQQRKAKLRLDVREGALKPASSGLAAIVPKDPANSELMKRILTEDRDELMPPPKTGKKLTPRQIDLLKAWITDDAPWESHWAFEAPPRPPLPAVSDTDWPRNEVDRFVMARLDKEKLQPSPEADRTTLIRRATFDLTGLPPTPGEVEAFLADASPGAYEKLVDRLLASPRYGENMARHWLDAARYADSHGYHIDAERSIWKYRDWVIESFNRNQPFDQFTTEQLAGDLLPNPTVAQQIASGYLRCNMSTGEGGAIVEEYQAKYTFDRTETMGTMWLGLTLICARCHSHKYDPVSQKEYYGLYTFFNNLDEAVMDGNGPNPAPTIRVPSPEQSQRQRRLKQDLADGRAMLRAAMPELDQRQAEWEKQWHERLGAGWTVLTPTEVNSTNGTQFRILSGGAVLVEGPNPAQDLHELTMPVKAGSLAALRLEALPHESLPKKSSARSDDGRFRLSELEAELVPCAAGDSAPKPQPLKFAQVFADHFEAQHPIGNAIDGKPETGWGIDADVVASPHAALFLLGEPIQVPDGAHLRVRLRYQASLSRRAIGHFRLAAAQNAELVDLLVPPKSLPWQVIGPFPSAGLRAGFTNVYEPEKALDFKRGYPGVREEIKWHAQGDIEDGKPYLLVSELHGVHGVFFLHRTLTLSKPRRVELSLRADDLFKLWVNGKLVAERATEEKPGEGPVRAVVDLPQGTHEVLVKVVNLQGAKYFTFNRQLATADTVPADLAVWFAISPKLSAAQQDKARVYFRRVNSPAWKTLDDQVAQWREEEAALDRVIPSTMIAKELAKPRETKLLVRGEYDKPGESIRAGVPSVLPPWPAGLPTNRLGLTKWLLDPSHPLTARVTVNRFWQQSFGIGLVKTTEDFGVQGEPPSHPELLDWLATEFVRTGWDVKRLQRLLVTSATYRQSSRALPELRARDPENRLLARGSRYRLDGEVVRDTALALSGLLVEQIGGRSVKPYEPPGLWEAVSYNNAQKYVPTTDEGQYRRSLYTYWKRQSPPPNMLLFDAPTREYCLVRRPRTNTPLQALALLNDPQFVEASHAFAQRILLEGGPTTKSRIAFAFRAATGRVPGDDEVEVVQETLLKQMAEYRANPAQAKQVLSVGTFRSQPTLDPSEVAAWTTIASMILNLDETITKG
jgi:hypothetical protein